MINLLITIGSFKYLVSVTDLTYEKLNNNESAFFIDQLSGHEINQELLN